MPDSPATRSTRAHFADLGSRTEGAGAANSSRVPARSRMAPRLIVAVVVGLAAGALTEWSVPHLPFSLEPLGNSAAPWVLVAFAVAFTARGSRESVLLAVVALLAMVLGFYVVEACRGWGVSRHQVALWCVAGVRSAR